MITSALTWCYSVGFYGEDRRRRRWRWQPVDVTRSKRFGGLFTIREFLAHITPQKLGGKSLPFSTIIYSQVWCFSLWGKTRGHIFGVDGKTRQRLGTAEDSCTTSEGRLCPGKVFARALITLALHQYIEEDLTLIPMNVYTLVVHIMGYFIRYMTHIKCIDSCYVTWWINGFDKIIFTGYLRFGSASILFFLFSEFESKKSALSLSQNFYNIALFYAWFIWRLKIYIFQI